MFLKRNRSAKMKGRGCADGRPQRNYITKEESSATTVSVYALIGFCVMDALDDRKVITGTYLVPSYKVNGHKTNIQDT